VMSLRDSPEEDLNLQACNQASNGPAARGISIWPMSAWDHVRRTTALTS
jgi:hypothetical protein